MIRVRGFSLLELLIVLAVMAGLAAVVFPSLTRPLAENEIGRAAASVRDMISQCRSDALSRKELQLIRFQANSSTIVCGDWESLIDAEESGGGRSLQLPDGIVVEQMVSGSVDSGSVDSGDVDSGGVDSGSEALVDVSDALGEKQSWYLPCLPTGQTKDSHIVLQDKLSGARCVLHVDGVLGMMRSERLQSLSGASKAAESLP